MGGGEGWKQGEETVLSTIFCGADLKGNGSEDSGRPENTENVQIFSYASFSCYCYSFLRQAGIAQWLGRRTRDRKVAGSSPDSSGRVEFPSPGSAFCADSYFGIRSTYRSST